MEKEKMESAYFTNYKSLERVYDSLLDAFISYLKDKVTPSCYDNFRNTIFKTSIIAKDRCYEEFFIDGIFKNFDWLPIYNEKQAEAIKGEIKKLNNNIEFLRTIKHSEEDYCLNGLSVGQRDGNTVKLIRFDEVYNHAVFTFTDAITAMSLQYLDDEKKYNALCREVIEQITQIKTHLHCLEADADLHKRKVKKYRKKIYRKRFGSFWDNIDSDDVMLFVSNFISIVGLFGFFGFFGLAGFAILKAGDIVEQPDTAITETVEMDNAYNIENMAENETDSSTLVIQEDDAEQYNTEQDIEQNIQDDEQNSVIDEEQNEVEQEDKTIEQVALLVFCLILLVFLVMPFILL